MITSKSVPKQTRECRPSFCNVCQIFFADPVIHATHSLTHSKGVFECAHCPAIARMTEEQVEAHVRIHMNDPKYTCKKCGAKLYNDSTATKHEKIHFGSKKPLLCGLCEATFLFPCTLSAHEKTEHGDVIDVYRKENKARQEEDIKKKKVVKDHMPYANKPLDPVLCQYCNHTFGSNIDYGHHLTKFHSLDEKFKCFLCKSAARMDKAGMENHLRRHEFAQTYKCSVCNEGFCHRQDAEDHERFHRNATVECSDCDSQFLFVRCLFSHLKNVHNIQAKGTKCSSCDQSHKEISSTPVDCEICNKTLPNARALQSHEKMHFPKGKLSCELCYQSFRSVEMLVKHVMLHDADDILELGLISDRVDSCGLEVEK